MEEIRDENGSSNRAILDKNRLAQNLNFEKKFWPLSKRDGTNYQSGLTP